MSFPCGTCPAELPKQRDLIENCSAVNPNVTYQQCGLCVDANTELEDTITDAYQAIMSLEVPVATLRTITVWDEGRIPLLQWIDRWFARKRLVVVAPQPQTPDDRDELTADDMEDLDNILDLMRDIDKPAQYTEEPKPAYEPRRLAVVVALFFAFLHNIWSHPHA